jgi:hypothetical protein
VISDVCDGRGDETACAGDALDLLGSTRMITGGLPPHLGEDFVDACSSIVRSVPAAR